MSLLLLVRFNYATERGDQQTWFTVECWSIKWYCGWLGCGDNTNMNVFPPLLRHSYHHASSYYMLVMSEAINICVALMCTNSSKHPDRQEKVISEARVFSFFFLHWFVLALGLAVLRAWHIGCLNLKYIFFIPLRSHSAGHTDSGITAVL